MLKHTLVQVGIAYLAEESSVASFALTQRMGDHKDKRVVVVGAGIVAVMAALEFCEAEYKAKVFERSSDPRNQKPWMAFGYTHGGNARIFLLTERDNYHDRTFGI